MIDEETDGDIEICVPVAAPSPGDSAVYGRELEGGTMATAIHHGPYQEISAAYHTLTGWISEHGHEMAGPPREIYLNDPQTRAARGAPHEGRVAHRSRAKLSADVSRAAPDETPFSSRPYGDMTATRRAESPTFAPGASASAGATVRSCNGGLR